MIKKNQKSSMILCLCVYHLPIINNHNYHPIVYVLYVYRHHHHHHHHYNQPPKTTTTTSTTTKTNHQIYYTQNKYKNTKNVLKYYKTKHNQHICVVLYFNVLFGSWFYVEKKNTNLLKKIIIIIIIMNE